MATPQGSGAALLPSWSQRQIGAKACSMPSRDSNKGASDSNNSWTQTTSGASRSRKDKTRSKCLEPSIFKLTSFKPGETCAICPILAEYINAQVRDPQAVQEEPRASRCPQDPARRGGDAGLGHGGHAGGREGAEFRRSIQGKIPDRHL